jgi:hypothetical protein
MDRSSLIPATTPSTPCHASPRPTAFDILGALNNILEQLTDVVGRAPAQAGSWMFTPTAAGIDTTIQVFETVLHEAFT